MAEMRQILYTQRLEIAPAAPHSQWCSPHVVHLSLNADDHTWSGRVNGVVRVLARGGQHGMHTAAA